MYTGTFGTVSNREDWEQGGDVVDNSGDEVIITGASAEMTVRKHGNCGPSLTASVGSGITIASPRLTFLFTEDQMDGLDPGQYDVGIRIKLSGDTKWSQLVVGTVTIVDGVVA